MRTRSLLSVLLLAFGAAASTSCFDPVHSDEIDALGPEINGVGPGPNHRPGQPCLVCHGDQGPASPQFSIAGTVYARRGKPEAQRGVQVVVTDVDGVTKTAVSNDVGNFYIPIATWSPTFPVSVELDSAGTVKPMITPIGRNGGCAFCHYGADNEKTHMPPVFLAP
jgi:hypothetical protein